MPTATPFPTDPALRMVGTLLLEVRMSNPNGDPAGGGSPRVLDDGRAFMTDAAVKRVVRDGLAREGHALYVARDSDLGLQQEQGGGLKAANASEADKAAAARRVGEAYIDVRLFGGALTRLGARPCGPFQLGMGVSLDPVTVRDVAITRVAGAKDEDGATRANMGSYRVVEYGIIEIPLFFDPNKAQSTALTPGLSSTDIEAFWAQLIWGWESNRSARRSQVYPRGLVVFATRTQAKRGGLEPGHVTRARLEVVRAFAPGETPTQPQDYAFCVRTAGLPEGMEVHQWWANPAQP